MIAPIPDWQQQAQAHFLQGNYSEAARLYEQAIASEPEIKSHYWQLGLLLLLDGQEEEAQMTWFDALSTADSEVEVQRWIAELVEVLNTEAQRQETRADYQTAWLIRQYIHENQPENIDNLLRSLILSIQLQLFIPDEDANLQQVISLLPQLSPAEVDGVLLLQVVQRILACDGTANRTSLSSQQLVDVCIAHYQNALAIQPPVAEWHYRLGTIYAEIQQTAEAIACYERALQIDPAYAEPYFSLGNVDLNQGNYERASAKYQQAIHLKPNFAKAYVNLAYVLEKEGNLNQAANHLIQAIEHKPDFAEAYRNLGGVLSQLDRLDEAIASCYKALEMKPDDATTYLNLGTALTNQGRTEEAISYFHKSLEIDPNLISAYHIHLLLPILYDYPEQIELWRQRFITGLHDFVCKISLKLNTQQRACLESIGFRTNFYLAYQGQNDLELQCQYGHLVQKIMSANYPHWSEPLSMPPLGENGKIRVGYISAFFRFHSVGNMTIGWLRYRDRQKFEVYTYYIGMTDDSMVQEFQQESDFFYHLPTNLEAICEQILSDRLHILVFPDIGMHQQTTQIAGLRLAPVQCVWAGHPVTTGLPTVDYFLSSDLMEPEDAQLHYSERLVCLPKLGFTYTKLPIPSVLKSRTDLQLPEDCVLYLSCQTLFKYLPQYDYIFAQIAACIPQAKLVFLGGAKDIYVTEQLRQRLNRAFSQAGLDMQQYCIFLPRLEWEDYVNLLLVSDISLDTIGFSGGNTTLQAIACNLPVVTMPSEFMRGRVSYGVMQTLGVTDTVAFSEAEYVDIAVKLGLDPQWRKQVAERIQLHHNRLFDDRTTIKALEEFYKQAILKS
jgi:predicted O-linked N-acetylglucosamine transferase (SPINDLY family)